MARPTKQGIDYFPLDCQFDDKIELFIIEKGANGLAVLVTLWQMIYANEGYYISNTNDLHLLISRRINVDINEVIACINGGLCRHLFCETMHDTHQILTSKAIQKRYFDAAKRKKTISVVREYLMNGINADNNWVNVDINSVNVDKNATNVKGKGDVNVNVNVKEQGGGVSDDKNPKPEKTYAQDIPYDDIIELYHKHAPSLKPCEKMTMQLMRDIQTLWNDKNTGLPDLEHWENFFIDCESSDWLTARTRSKRRAHLLRELVAPETYAKIYEGAYE